MKFWEAMKALEEGKKVRVKTWTDKNSCVVQDFLGAVDNEGRPWEQAHFFIGKNNKYLEWELYEEPPKTYSFTEVVKGLKEGKRFKRKHWDRPIHLLGSVLMPCGVWEPCYFNTQDYQATDWVEVK